MNQKAKDMVYEDQAREYLFKGITTLAEVVGITLGPKGKNVSFGAFGLPKITNQGNSCSQQRIDKALLVYR